MYSDRPKLKIPFLAIDIVIELVSITLLILMWTNLIIEYNSLPETIASHFNAKGEPDDYSKKMFLWLLPSLATIMYIGLLILSRYPHLHNYMVNITKDNAFKQYQFSTRVLRIVNGLCVLLFAYINYQIIIGAQNNSSELGTGFLSIVIGCSLLLPIIIFAYQHKIKKIR